MMAVDLISPNPLVDPSLNLRPSKQAQTVREAIQSRPQYGWEQLVMNTTEDAKSNTRFACAYRNLSVGSI